MCRDPSNRGHYSYRNFPSILLRDKTTFYKNHTHFLVVTLGSPIFWSVGYALFKKMGGLIFIGNKVIGVS